MGIMAGGDEYGVKELTIEFTPTWIVASVCTVIVIISLFFERFLHYGGTILQKRRQKPLYEALLKVKEELMLLGFISLLLSIFQGPLAKICVTTSFMDHMRPCKSKKATKHLAVAFLPGVFGGARRLLEDGVHDGLLAAGASDHCLKKGKVPLLSAEAVHQLHIFIFALAATHVVLSAITVLLGMTRIQKWRHWENKIQEEMLTDNLDSTSPPAIRLVRQLTFIRDRYEGFGSAGGLYGWLHAFFKQFYGLIGEEDYTTMRLGFINKHCRSNRQFNFYKYMKRALEADYKKVVGISWYLWGLVMIFLLLNVNGWHAYFWLSLVPLIMLLIIGAKLEHIVTELAHEVAERHFAVEGDLLVTPSDEFFWFHRPKIVLVLIRFILFENSFQIAYFFWVLTTYGFNSCIMGPDGFLIPRLVSSGIVQIVCCYSTLPLYAIVSNMGSSFKKAIFKDYVQECLENWLEDVRSRRRAAAHEGSHENQSREHRTESEMELSGTNGSSHETRAEEARFRNGSSHESREKEVEAESEIEEERARVTGELQVTIEGTGEDSSHSN